MPEITRPELIDLTDAEVEAVSGGQTAIGGAGGNGGNGSAFSFNLSNLGNGGAGGSFDFSFTEVGNGGAGGAGGGATASA